MTTPGYLSFFGQVFLSDPAQALAATRAAAGAAGLPELSAWQAGQGLLRSGIDGLAAAATTAASLDLNFGAATRAFIDQSAEAKRGPDPWCEIRLHLPTSAGYAAAVRQGRHFAEHLLLHGALGPASLERAVGSGGDCVPDPPIAQRHLLIVAHAANIAAAFTDPAAFHAAWDDGREEDGYCLRIRAIEAASGPDFLAAIQDGQWAMARAARPGLTRYLPPEVTADEDAIYRRSPARLQEVGYIEPAGIVEYTSVVGPGQHLAGWEIHRLAALVQAGRMGDGKPVHAVRVVFLDRAAAETEKRPLLDLGIRVLALGDHGLPMVVNP